MNVTHLIETYGYLAVFLLVGAESLGIPLPGETALIIAGTYAGHSHRLNPFALWAIASAAAIIGDNIGFLIGDKGGYPIARKYGPKVRLDERKLKTARYLFDRQGGKVVFFGRWVSVLRAYAAFLAGVAKMHWRKFLVANAAGGILWAGVYTFASYLAGHAFENLSRIVSFALLGGAVLVIAVTLFAIRHQFSKLADQAEIEYPGPLG